MGLTKTGTIARPSSEHTEIKLWNWQKGILIRTLTGQQGENALIVSMVFSKDGKLLASGSSNGQIDIWHIPTGQQLKTLTGCQHLDSIERQDWQETTKRLFINFKALAQKMNLRNGERTSAEKLEAKQRHEGVSAR